MRKFKCIQVPVDTYYGEGEFTLGKEYDMVEPPSRNKVYPDVRLITDDGSAKWEEIKFFEEVVEADSYKMLPSTRLVRAFGWSSTPQGHEYWSQVHCNLKKMGK